MQDAARRTGHGWQRIDRFPIPECPGLIRGVSRPIPDEADRTLQQIFHLHLFGDRRAADGEAGGIEAGRAEADGGVAGEAEAFARHGHDRVEPAIAVFVMDQRDGIIGGGQPVEPQRGGIGGAHRPLARGGVILTIGEMIGRGGEAHHDIALQRAQPGDAEINPPGGTGPRQQGQRRDQQRGL